MSDCPAGRGRAKTETGLKGKIVNLVDHAVDVIAQRCSGFFNSAVVPDQLCGSIAPPGQRVCRKSQCSETLDRIELGVRQRFRHFAPCVRKKAQRSRCCYGRVELAQGSGSGVSWICKDFCSGCVLGFVQGRKLCVPHINLSPHFKDVGRAGNLFRDVLNGFGVCRHVFAGFAVAAGRGLNKVSVLVSKRQRQSVYLWLCGESQCVFGRQG